MALAAAFTWHPAATAAVTSGLLAIALCAAPRQLSVRWAWWLFLAALTGYAFLGKAFARIGFGQLYVGEAVLFVVLCASMARGTLWSPLRSTSGKLLLLFLLWCAARTAPYIGVYGIHALRDGAVWGYGLFAFAIAGAVLRHGAVHTIAAGYSRLIWPFVLWLLLVGTVRALAPQAGLGAGFTAGTLLKPGDVSVHLAGIAAFVLLGLHRFGVSDKGRAWIQEWLLWPVWLVNFLLSASQNRGGLLSILTALAVVLLLWMRGGWGKLAMVSLCILTAFAFWDLEVDVGAPRRVSVEQIQENLSSVTGEAGDVSRGTRQWRLSWWRKIWGYTVEGEYFWGGKGFGLNLASDDGFQTDAAHSLRSPHNGHLTVLARSGVPGFGLWILIQASLWLGLLDRYVRARRGGQTGRAAFIVWILGYLTAMTVNSAFDVYLEGPQGGIWYWTVVGVGLSVLAAPAAKPHRIRLPAARFAARAAPARAS